MYRDTGGDTRPRVKRRKTLYMRYILIQCNSWMSIVRFFVKNIFSREIHVSDLLRRIERDRSFAFLFVRRVPRKSNRSTLFLIDTRDRCSMLRTRKDLLGPARLLKNDRNDRKVNFSRKSRLFSDVFEFTRVDRCSF